MRYLKHFTAVLALAALPGAPDLGAAEAGFSLRLAFTNAHLRELFLGWRDDASDKYDRGIDDFAPPPGIATGYVGFFPAEKLPLFYRDIRGPRGPHEWKLYVRVHQDNVVDISWEKDELPDDWVFTLQIDDTAVDMRKKEKLSVAETKTLTIRAETRTAASTTDEPG